MKRTIVPLKQTLVTMWFPQLFLSKIARTSPRACYSCSFSSTSHSATSAKNPKDPKTPAGSQDHVEWRKHQLESAKLSLYPHKFDARDRISDVVRDYSDRLGKGERVVADPVGGSVSVAGRIHGVRQASKNLHFIDLKSGDGEIQVRANAKHYSSQVNFSGEVHALRRGDVVGVVGVPCRTLAGELSIDASRIMMLSPCLRMMPNPKMTLENMDKRFRRRHVDLLANPERREIFRTRAAILLELRRFLEARDFLEVETPILGIGYGGASARPFKTHHNDHKAKMFLRIAPELYLKQLVVGGFDRVFEVGRQFRNEGIDATHNPEFTTCEFYMAYSDRGDVMDMTEQLFGAVATNVLGSTKFSYPMLDGNKRREVVFDFEGPFKRIEYLSAIQAAVKKELPTPEEVYTDLPEARDYIRSLEPDVLEPYRYQNLSCGKLLDKLFSKIVEPTLMDPTFVLDHPLSESPLAKEHRSKPFIAERFELFVGGNELANAYTEQNDPDTQREHFRRQQQQLGNECQVAAEHDEAFVRVLEYGLPPTAGFGLGVDRLVMLLTRQTSIKEVLAFPTLRPMQSKSDGDERVGE